MGTKIVAEKDGSKHFTVPNHKKGTEIQNFTKLFHGTGGKIFFLFHLFPRIKFTFQERI